MNKPAPKKITKHISKAETQAAKRSGMIIVMRDVSLSLEQANAELVRVKLEPMNAAEAAEYSAAINATITTADILGAAPEAAKPIPAAPVEPATPSKDAAKTAALRDVQVAVLHKTLDQVGALLRSCAPAKVAEYKAMKHAGKRADAYGFALAEIMKAMGE